MTDIIQYTCTECTVLKFDKAKRDQPAYIGKVWSDYLNCEAIVIYHGSTPTTDELDQFIINSEKESIW